MSRTATISGDPIGKNVSAFYQDELDKIAKKYDIDIELIICHGKWEVVPADMSFDKLYIFVQLLPKECTSAGKANIERCYINGEEFVFPVDTTKSVPCPQGEFLTFKDVPEKAEVITDDKGFPLGMVYDSSVYIFNDFRHSRKQSELEASMVFFKYLMNEAFKKTTLLNQLKSGLEDKSKRALEIALKSLFSSRIDKELIQLKAAKDTITQYEKGITDAVRKVISTEKVVESIKRNMADVPRALQKTWDEINKLKDSAMYENIAFTKSGIKAYTTPIVIEWNHKKYAMGKYQVDLNFDGTCQIFNTGKKVDKFDHPHINAGQVCWGNFSGYIPKLIGSSEFDVALTQIHTFLCHYDSGNPYKGIENWPLVEKETKKTDKKQEGLEVMG